MTQKRVILFGVGSWCAESLVRSGIRHLTIVDSDRVCITNINRQLMATTETVGRVKVDALKQRLLSINPSADITAIFGFMLAGLVIQDVANVPPVPVSSASNQQ